MTKAEHTRQLFIVTAAPVFNKKGYEIQQATKLTKGAIYGNFSNENELTAAAFQYNCISRDEQEVIGYYEVLELIYEHYTGIRLSESYIKQLYQMLLKYSNKDERYLHSQIKSIKIVV